ncbi:MAG: hypothetical protein KIS76_16930 [Pyrinomonadaceae bacterium]|nr:hypothetical protein [Pyrinomonadaceae bacterium]
MSAVTELNPEIAQQILTTAKLKGISVEVYLQKIVQEKDDSRLLAMQEAVNDQLFLEDLADTLEDFKHTDSE